MQDFVRRAVEMLDSRQNESGDTHKAATGHGKTSGLGRYTMAALKLSRMATVQ